MLEYLHRGLTVRVPLAVIVSLGWACAQSATKLPMVAVMPLSSEEVKGAASRVVTEALARFLPRLDDYGTDRDLPAVDGTSALSPHLRFGTISAREMVRAARESRSPGASKWISEIAWRDFYQMVLRHFPGSVDHAF